MGLPKEKLREIYEIMIKTRAMEERLIKMSKSEDGFFWIGGPGEEAFNVPLGLQVKKGEGPEYDYLHLHYRSSGIAMAMGVSIIDCIRQMNCRATDPFSAGRNFCNHYAIKKWNIVPMTPTLEVQYAMAPGTAIAQKRFGSTGITIVNGGDAATAEADFESCLLWASRPDNELPILILVGNNNYGISTPYNEVQGLKNISDRGKPYGMKTHRINGNDPEESWAAIDEAMKYIRKNRKPYLLQYDVSRLHGHSSSTGGNYVENEYDCLRDYEAKIIDKGVMTKKEIDETWEKYSKECSDALEMVKKEPAPTGDDIWKHIFKESSN